MNEVTTQTGPTISVRLDRTQTVSVNADTVQEALNTLAQSVQSDLFVLRRGEDGTEWYTVNGDVLLLREGQAPRVVASGEALQANDRIYVSPRQSNG